MYLYMNKSSLKLRWEVGNVLKQIALHKRHVHTCRCRIMFAIFNRILGCTLLGRKLADDPNCS